MRKAEEREAFYLRRNIEVAINISIVKPKPMKQYIKSLIG